MKNILTPPLDYSLLNITTENKSRNNIKTKTMNEKMCSTGTFTNFSGTKNKNIQNNSILYEYNSKSKFKKTRNSSLINNGIKTNLIPPIDNPNINIHYQNFDSSTSKLNFKNKTFKEIKSKNSFSMDFKTKNYFLNTKKLFTKTGETFLPKNNSITNIFKKQDFSITNTNLIDNLFDRFLKENE